MIPFSPGELALDRAPFAAALPDTAVLWRPTRTVTAGGGRQASYVAQSAVACRIAPAQRLAAEQEQAGRTAPVGDWQLTFAAATDVQSADVVQIGGTAQPAGTSLGRAALVALGGRAFEVTGVDTRSQELSRRVTAVTVG